MPEFALPRAGERLDLDYGYTLTADAVTGRVVSRGAQQMTSRPLDVDEFDVRLEAAGVGPGKTIELKPAAVQTRGLNDPPPSVTLEIEHARGTRALVLVQDAAGALRWQLPD